LCGRNEIANGVPCDVVQTVYQAFFTLKMSCDQTVHACYCLTAIRKFLPYACVFVGRWTLLRTSGWPVPRSVPEHSTTESTEVFPHSVLQEQTDLRKVLNGKRSVPRNL
jgi:hypothetical protein